MADLLSRSNQVQSTEWSLHPQVFNQICQKWFTICHSSEPQTSTVRVSSPRPKCLGHRCSEHKMDGFHCLCLPSDSSPSQGDPKNQAMPLPDHRNSPRLARDALVLGPSAALNRDPTSTSSVNNSSQTVPQLCVPQQSTTSQPPRLVLGVDSSKNKASLWRWQRELLPLRGHQQEPSTSQSGPYEMVQRKFSGFLHSLCETSLRLFDVSVPRSKQAPLDH